MMTLRKTKIVATLGPSSGTEEVIEHLISVGVDVVRLNFSHGSAEDHIERAGLVRLIAKRLHRPIGVLCDLQGPKIRIGKFVDGKILLKAGDHFILDAACPLGSQERVGLDYTTLPQEVEPGAVLLLDDGHIVIQVVAVHGQEVHCHVTHGGVLSNNKGINRLGGGLSAEALTPKDREDIKVAAMLEADYVALSFPRSGADVELARDLIRAAGSHADIVAKIERAEAIPALDEIIAAADAIMVARGDLGVEVGDAAVPGLQKRMIRQARLQNKLVITATQMLESMITSPIPTRAEVSDVANAVLDGTDAVMLSAETAVGQYPVESVEAMHRVCLEAEKEAENLYPWSADKQIERIDEAVALATIHIARHLQVKAIAALTQSGSTALWLSRTYTRVPIFALTPERATRRKLALYRGVYPYPIHIVAGDRDTVLHDVEIELLRRGVVNLGDLILLTIGEPVGKVGGTNTLKIVRVGERNAAADVRVGLAEQGILTAGYDID